jgi:hypothetical protein
VIGMPSIQGSKNIVMFVTVLLLELPLAAASFEHTHTLLDELLARHVKDGRVDYTGLEADRQQLQNYLALVGEVSENEFHEFTQNQQLAFLINAYNAFTLELIVQHYPVVSIRDIPGNWTEPQWSLLGRQFNLNDIENKIIRPRYHEPRIHFALVCAANGCPPLQSEAYLAARLPDQLAAVSREYARDSRFNHLDEKSATLFVSKIFEWYQQDFVAMWGETELPENSEASAEHRGVVGFFLTHLEEEVADFLRRKAVTIRYLEYDWGLNDSHREDQQGGEKK